MSLLNRRHLLLMPLALAACGFTPAYAPGAQGASLLGTVWAADPKSRDDFDFVERIEERIGRPKDRLYELSYTVSTNTSGIGYTSDSRTTRYNIEGVVTYRLTRSAGGAEVARGRVQGFTAFAATGSTVAGLAAEEDAGQRLMRMLADRVVARLVAQLAAAQHQPAAVAPAPQG